MLLRSFAALCLMASSASASMRTSDGATSLEGDFDPYAIPVTKTVASIVEYSRWPEDRRAIRLCVAGPTLHTENLGERRLAHSRVLRPLSIDTVADSVSRCDAVYLGQMPLDHQRRFVEAARDQPILTIVEDDPACLSGAMVCLLFDANAVSFRINVDAVSRSQVRVDPRLLRMSARRSSA
jgi:hypothetical protein